MNVFLKGVEMDAGLHLMWNLISNTACQWKTSRKQPLWCLKNTAHINLLVQVKRSLNRHSNVYNAIRLKEKTREKRQTGYTSVRLCYVLLISCVLFRFRGSDKLHLGHWAGLSWEIQFSTHLYTNAQKLSAKGITHKDIRLRRYKQTHWCLDWRNWEINRSSPG